MFKMMRNIFTFISIILYQNSLSQIINHILIILFKNFHPFCFPNKVALAVGAAFGNGDCIPTKSNIEYPNSPWLFKSQLKKCSHLNLVSNINIASFKQVNAVHIFFLFMNYVLTF